MLPEVPPSPALLRGRNSAACPVALNQFAELPVALEEPGKGKAFLTPQYLMPFNSKARFFHLGLEGRGYWYLTSSAEGPGAISAIADQNGQFNAQAQNTTPFI